MERLVSRLMRRVAVGSHRRCWIVGKRVPGTSVAASTGSRPAWLAHTYGAKRAVTRHTASRRWRCRELHVPPAGPTAARRRLRSPKSTSGQRWCPRRHGSRDRTKASAVRPLPTAASPRCSTAGRSEVGIPGTPGTCTCPGPQLVRHLTTDRRLTHPDTRVRRSLVVLTPIRALPAVSTLASGPAVGDTSCPSAPAEHRAAANTALQAPTGHAALTHPELPAELALGATTRGAALPISGPLEGSGGWRGTSSPGPRGPFDEPLPPSISPTAATGGSRSRVVGLASGSPPVIDPSGSSTPDPRQRVSARRGAPSFVQRRIARREGSTLIDTGAIAGEAAERGPRRDWRLTRQQARPMASCRVLSFRVGSGSDARPAGSPRDPRQPAPLHRGRGA